MNLSEVCYHVWYFNFDHVLQEMLLFHTGEKYFLVIFHLKFKLNISLESPCSTQEHCLFSF